MSIIAGDFVTRLSGGSGNSSGNASLGGAKSSTNAPTSLDGLFDPVAAADASAGDIEYRCVYLHNANGSDTMTSAVVWLQSDTPGTDNRIAIGVGTAAINGTEQTIANEDTAPSGVSFSQPANAAAGLALGNIPAGQHKAIWIRRTVDASAAANPSRGFSLGYQAETT